jgi:hypothetical protein
MNGKRRFFKELAVRPELVEACPEHGEGGECVYSKATSHHAFIA